MFQPTPTQETDDDLFFCDHHVGDEITDSDDIGDEIMNEIAHGRAPGVGSVEGTSVCRREGPIRVQLYEPSGHPVLDRLDSSAAPQTPADEMEDQYPQWQD